jgi:DNA-binding transcriptional MerR regulator
MRIGEVARLTGVPIKTIRYYEEIGVLASPKRSHSGYREYDPEVIDRLRFIRSSKSVGFTLGEIREIVNYRDRGEVPCAHVLDLLRHHRDECAKRITQLQHAEQALDALVERAAHLRQEDCSPESVCHLVPRAAERGA